MDERFDLSYLLKSHLNDMQINVRFITSSYVLHLQAHPLRSEDEGAGQHLRRSLHPITIS